ncbi:MAG TPA: hypothetical protein VEA99_01385, partial [Gemmatimonadaceae bacterium]|nr:hypothetical protein [Gemmatimonadaceae bacterium]
MAAVTVAVAAGCKGEVRRERVVERGGRVRVVDSAADTGGTLITAPTPDSLLQVQRPVGGVVTLRAECAACHPAAHDVPLGRGPDASASCDGCHETEHASIQALYAGMVHGGVVRPNPKFAARVACAGCHSDTTFAIRDRDARLAAMEQLCTQCHGPSFEGMLSRWSMGLAWRERAVSAYVAQASADPRLAARPAARARVDAAQQAIALVRSAGGIHNVRGADQLLRTALDGTVAAYSFAGLGAPTRPALGPDPSRDSCMGCHYGMEAGRSTA